MQSQRVSLFPQLWMHQNISLVLILVMVTSCASSIMLAGLNSGSSATWVGDLSKLKKDVTEAINTSQCLPRCEAPSLVLGEATNTTCPSCSGMKEICRHLRHKVNAKNSIFLFHSLKIEQKWVAYYTKTLSMRTHSMGLRRCACISVHASSHIIVHSWFQTW